MPSLSLVPLTNDLAETNLCETYLHLSRVWLRPREIPRRVYWGVPHTFQASILLSRSWIRALSSLSPSVVSAEEAAGSLGATNTGSAGRRGASSSTGGSTRTGTGIFTSTVSTMRTTVGGGTFFPPHAAVTTKTRVTSVLFLKGHL